MTERRKDWGLFAAQRAARCISWAVALRRWATRPAAGRSPVWLLVFSLLLAPVGTPVSAGLGIVGAPALNGRQDYVAARTRVAAPTYQSGVTDLWGGAIESIALRSDGTVWTWGWDDFGILGNGHGVPMTSSVTTFNSAVPLEVLGPGGAGHLSLIAAIAGGERHNVALDANGNVWIWGWNAFGQLGTNGTCSGWYSPNCMGTTPAQVPSLTGVKAIAARGYHTLALKQNGTVWAWGYNNSGRLGDGTNINRFVPVQLGGLTGHGGVLAISGGGDVSAALMADHTLMAWGTNANGAVGNGVTNLTGQWTPTEMSQSTGLSNVVSIATGWDHMVALAQDGSVWTWGLNTDGELGNGTTISSSVPIRVNGLGQVIGVSAGDGSTAVLTADHKVWAWGVLRHGNGTYYSIGRSPGLVAGIDNVTLVRDRDWHILALKADGTVWAWGSNQAGEIGNGTVKGNTDAPARVLFPDVSLLLPLSLFLPMMQR